MLSTNVMVSALLAMPSRFGFASWAELVKMAQGGEISCRQVSVNSKITERL